MKRWNGSAWVDVAKITVLSDFMAPVDDPGEYISSGIVLDVDPNRDTVTVDAEGVITSYALKDFPRTAPLSGNLGSTDLYEALGTNNWTVTDVNAVTCTAATDSRRARVLKEQLSIGEDVDVVVESQVQSGTRLSGLFICNDSSVTDTNFKCYMGGFDNNTVTLRVYKGASPSVTWTIARTFNLGTWYKIRLKKSGTTLQLKVWPSSDNEPTEWDITQTDSTYSSGGVGVYAFYTGVTYFRNLTFLGWNGNRVHQGGHLVQTVGVNNGRKRIQGPFTLRMWPQFWNFVSPFTIFLVAKHPFTSGITYKMLNLRGSHPALGVYAASGKREIGPYNNNIGTTMNIPYTPMAHESDPFVHCAVVDIGASPKLVATHQGAACTIASTTNSPGWVVGAHDSISMDEYGELLEIVLYNRALSSTEVEKMTKYLMTKWDCKTRMFGYSF